MAGDRVVHVDAVHIALFQRTDSARRMPRLHLTTSSCPRRWPRLFQQRDRFARQRVLDAVGDEAGDVAAHQHGPLADGAQRVHHDGDGGFRGVVVAHHFHQRDHVGGREEVRADEAFAARRGAGQGVDRQAGYWWRRSRRARRWRQLRENAALEFQVSGTASITRSQSAAASRSGDMRMRAIASASSPAAYTPSWRAMLARAVQRPVHRVDQHDRRAARANNAAMPLPMPPAPTTARCLREYS